MEKHAKLSNAWVNGPLSSDPVKEFTFKVKETNGSGGAQQGHYLYVNYNVTTHNHLALQNNFIICQKAQC
jgi:phosphate-selective porin